MNFPGDYDKRSNRPERTVTSDLSVFSLQFGIALFTEQPAICFVYV